GAGPADRARIAGRVLAARRRAVALIDGAGISVRRARGARRIPGVGGTARTAAGAVLGGIALAGGATALGRRRLERVRRTHRARAGAALRHVADAGHGAAFRARVAGRMLAVVVGAVALVEAARVTVLAARGAGRHLGVRGAVGTV